MNAIRLGPAASRLERRTREATKSRETLLTRVLPVVGAACALIALRRLTRNRESFAGKTVLITGGARGLGIEMARLWRAEGANVAICSRSVADLNGALAELGTEGVFVQVCDVTDQQQVRDFVGGVERRWGTIDVLVNDAGIIQGGPAVCMTLDDYRQAMDTHFWGPLFLIQAVLPGMRSQGAGTIVNVASIGGKVSVPHLVPYCASKFALVGLSEGLHAELAAYGIHVLTVCPGLMRTGSPRNALFKGRHRQEYAWFSISDSIPGLTMSSRRAARQIIKACRNKKAEVILSLPAAIAARAYAVFPGLASRIMTLGNRLLPSPGGIGTQSARGAESQSALSPSPLTILTERAAARNNEMR